MRARGVADITSRIGSVKCTGHYAISVKLRRIRGAVLRLVRSRLTSLALGLALVLPAAWVRFQGRIDAWWVEGLSLVALAIGVALLWTALVGLRPDWEE